MELGGALFLFAIILPSFSTAVPLHDSHVTYLQKRAEPLGTPSEPGGSADDAGDSAGIGSLLGTQQAYNATGKNDTGLLGTEKNSTVGGAGDTESEKGLLGTQQTHNATGMNDTSLLGTQHAYNASGMNDTSLLGTHDSSAVGGTKNSTGSSSLQLLQQILNHTLSTLPGLEKLSAQVEKLMAGQLEDAVEKAQGTPDSPGSRTDVREGLQSSFNATAKNSVNVTAPVEMQGTDAHGRACETRGYITLSATTLTTLSGLFQGLVRLEKTISTDGSKKSYTVLQVARAKVSFTMLSVIKLTATPAVTSCYVPPSQTTFSAQIQANVSMCAEMITKFEKDYKTGKVTASRATALDADTSVGANATLNSTSGGPSKGFPNASLLGDTAAGHNATSNTTGLGSPTYSGADGGKTSLLGAGNNATSNTTGLGGSGSPTYSGADGTGTKLLGEGTSPNATNLTSVSPTGLGGGSSTSLASGDGADSSSSVDVDQFAEVKARFAASVQVTTGLVTSHPSEGSQGIHIGASASAEINVDIKSRVAVRSSEIDNFLDTVNGGTAAQPHDAHVNPQIQDKDGMGILQDFGGDIFGDFFSKFMGSLTGGMPGGGGGGSSSGSDTDGGGGYSLSGMGPSSGIGGDTGSGTHPTDTSPYSANSTSGGMGGGESDHGGSYGGGKGVSALGSDSGDPGGKNGTLTDAVGTGSGEPGHSSGLGGSPGSEKGASLSDLSGSGSGSPKCECPPDHSTHLRIRSLEAQLERVHRVMHKRGLTEL
ncbi:hypothetical protein PCANC_09303 [Puccinia coronata f. sp. avenae]|uniref:Uncharacterized protein n=1 Tax=Puccinia coronata f. sp. avenae TaxID=200324 RepID=A0A2N5T5K5_9BASI|nr:hypothetical protein PCANC_09303 [Puccinia coronata f. sp. avenae]